eukprot:370367-Pleurochrysis_carterae.AAC.4
MARRACVPTGCRLAPSERSVSSCSLHIEHMDVFGFMPKIGKCYLLLLGDVRGKRPNLGTRKELGHDTL